MSSMALKLIAIVCMIIDHTGAVLRHTMEHGELSMTMRMVGRVAFPIFAFLIAEGMRKTRSRPNFLLWLGTFAVISIIPFSMFSTVTRWGLYISPNYFDFSYNNVFFTLFLGAGSIYAFDLIREKLKNTGKGIPGYALGLICPVICAYAAYAINTDYSQRGVLLIFTTYLVMSIKDCRFLRVLPMVVWAHIQYAPGLLPEWVPLIGGGLRHMAVFAAVAPLLILLYDGSPGPAWLRGRFKVAFYLFYPAHMLILAGWSIYLRTPLW